MTAMPDRPRPIPARGIAPLLALVLAAAPPVGAQQDLTVEAIFGSGELLPGGLPELEWTPDGRRFTWVQAARDGHTDLLAQDPRTGVTEVLVDGSDLVPPGELEPVDIEGYQWGPREERMLVYTRSQRVWRQNTKGVYFVLDLSSGEMRPLSTAFGWQQFAKFSPDGTKVGFVRDNDLWVVDLATMRERRLTDDGSENVINGTFDWVYEEELGLRDGWRWSPDSRRIAFWRLDQSPVKAFHMIDDLGLYSEPVPVRYPKAGEPNSVAEIGVVEVGEGSVTWMDTGDNPDVYLARMEWAASADELVIQRLNRHQNRLDVLLADATTGGSRTILTETSDTWIDLDQDLAWVEGGRRFLWTSERSGWEHLYLYERDGTLVRALTSGEWDVRAPHGVRDGRWVYFSASGEGPLELHLYRVPLDGGDPERISGRPGWHDVTASPDLTFYVDEWSRAGVPPVYSVHDGDGTRVRTLVDNETLRQRLAGLNAPEFFTFTTDEGVDLNGWIVRPPDFDEGREYPVLMYVYGGPGSQTVTDSWGGTRYLWHQLLAQDGYVVASVDNRGTGARGRDFKNQTYRRLGVLEARDQVAAARHLGSLDYVDPDRVGIWGWSYGGYMTLLAMFTGGDLFRAGISVAPVTHWKFYDTIYTERFMRTPRENPEGYAAGAPLDRVEGLDGDLLLIHGTGDDNVHFQNTVALTDALQEAGKQFELMIYPNQTHSISDRRVHLYRLMTDFVHENLPTGSRDVAAAGAGR